MRQPGQPYLLFKLGFVRLRLDKLVPLTVENDCLAFDFHYRAKKGHTEVVLKWVSKLLTKHYSQENLIKNLKKIATLHF